MWTILYSDIVIKKHIPTLSSSVKKRIKQSIEAKLITNPIHFGKPLRYSLNNMRSLRVGDYRVIYQINHSEKSIKITAIGHRSKIYD